jgi:hypothetical protein
LRAFRAGKTNSEPVIFRAPPSVTVVPESLSRLFNRSTISANKFVGFVGGGSELFDGSFELSDGFFVI